MNRLLNWIKRYKRVSPLTEKFFISLGFKLEKTEFKGEDKHEYFTWGYIILEKRSRITAYGEDILFTINITPIESRTHFLFKGRIKTRKQFHLIMKLLQIDFYKRHKIETKQLEDE